MKIAKQADLDDFYSSVFLNETIYPYLTTSRFSTEWTEPKNDWECIYLTDENLSFMACCRFDRSRGEPELNVCLYAKSTIAAGRGVLAVKYIINRYKPKAINSVVHASNIKSLKLHSRIFGTPWGIEPLIAWNSLLGGFEDLHYFRKLL